MEKLLTYEEWDRQYKAHLHKMEKLKRKQAAKRRQKFLELLPQKLAGIVTIILCVVFTALTYELSFAIIMFPIAVVMIFAREKVWG